MSDNTTPWVDVSPTIEQTQEGFFSEWIGMERRFGEFGEPGFSDRTMTVSNFPGTFGHSNAVDVRFTFFRGEDGMLLCVYGSYIENGFEKAFFLNVHPDHQRQGIGTMMADHVAARYEAENGIPLVYKESWGQATYTLPSANFVNKYVTNAISTTGENE